MAKVHTDWRVLDHGPIERNEDNLWTVTGSLPGMSLKRVMTLIRLEDGRVLVHSAIALDEAAMGEIEAWGRPAVLLVPNAYHRLDAPAYLSRYPGLEVYCPKGARAQVEKVVKVDGDYGDVPDDPTVSLEHLDGVRFAEGVVVVRSGARATLVVNDAVFNIPHGSGLPGFIFRYITGSTGGPRVSRLFRIFAVNDKRALAGHLRRLADTPDLCRVIVSHHRPITDRPAETLRAVADRL
jgi:hypothetical protein